MVWQEERKDRLDSKINKEMTIVLVKMNVIINNLCLTKSRHEITCTTLRGWTKGTMVSSYTANHKEYLQVPIRVVKPPECKLS